MHHKTEFDVVFDDSSWVPCVLVVDGRAVGTVVGGHTGFGWHSLMFPSSRIVAFVPLCASRFFIDCLSLVRGFGIAGQTVMARLRKSPLGCLRCDGTAET